VRQPPKPKPRNLDAEIWAAPRAVFIPPALQARPPTRKPPPSVVTPRETAADRAREQARLADLARKRPVRLDVPQQPRTITEGAAIPPPRRSARERLTGPGSRISQTTGIARGARTAAGALGTAAAESAVSKMMGPPPGRPSPLGISREVEAALSGAREATAPVHGAVKWGLVGPDLWQASVGEEFSTPWAAVDVALLPAVVVARPLRAGRAVVQALTQAPKGGAEVRAAYEAAMEGPMLATKIVRSAQRSPVLRSPERAEVHEALGRIAADPKSRQASIGQLDAEVYEAVRGLPPRDRKEAAALLFRGIRAQLNDEPQEVIDAFSEQVLEVGRRAADRGVRNSLKGRTNKRVVLEVNDPDLGPYRLDGILRGVDEDGIRIVVPPGEVKQGAKVKGHTYVVPVRQVARAGAAKDMRSAARLPLREDVLALKGLPRQPSPASIRVADELRGLGVALPERLARPGELEASVEMVSSLAREGAEFRHWYQEAGRNARLLAEETGVTVDQAAQALAIFSTQADPTVNFGFALKAIRQHQSKQKVWSGRYPKRQTESFLKAMWGEEWKGRKRNSFYLNILRHADPEMYAKRLADAGRAGAPITVDMWVVRMFAPWVRKDVPERFYDAYEQALIRMADDFGWAPEEVQAAAWVAAKKRGIIPSDVRRSGAKGHRVSTTEERALERARDAYGEGVRQHLRGESVRGGVRRGGRPPVVDFTEVPASESERFLAALRRNEHTWSVSEPELERLAGARLFLTADETAGYAIYPDGELGSVFRNADGVKGAGYEGTLQGAHQGAQWLNVYDLPKLRGTYEQAGFVEVARLRWDPAYAEHLPAHISAQEPDVVFMAFGAKPHAPRYFDEWADAEQYTRELSEPVFSPGGRWRREGWEVEPITVREGAARRASAEVPAGWTERGLDFERRWDALPDDAEVVLFHATDKKTAARMARDGIDPSGKPMSLARQRFQAGEEAVFQPGAGLSSGLTVGHTPWDVSGYGRALVAVRVPKGAVLVSPEQAALGASRPSQAVRVNDAEIQAIVPPSRVQILDTKGRQPGPEILSQVKRDAPRDGVVTLERLVAQADPPPALVERRELRDAESWQERLSTFVGEERAELAIDLTRPSLDAPYEPRMLRAGASEVQALRPRDPLARLMTRAQDFLSHSIDKQWVRDTRGIRLLTMSERVTKQLGRIERQEAMRQPAQFHQALKAISRVPEGSVEDTAHFWYAQLPEQWRNAEGLERVASAQRLELRDLMDGTVARELDEMEAAVRAQMREISDVSEHMRLVSDLGEIRLLRTDIPLKIEDLSAAIVRIEEAARAAPAVDDELLAAMRRLAGEREKILARAGRVNPERMEERTGLVSRWLNVDPDGSEIYVGHRLPREPGRGAPVQPSAGTGRVTPPQGMSTNKLRLATSGRLRTSTRVAVDDFRQAMVFDQANRARDILAQLPGARKYKPGEPFKRDWVLVNPKGRTIPRWWRTDELAQFTDDAKSIEQLREQSRQIVDGFMSASDEGAAGWERLLNEATEQGIQWDELVMVPERQVKRFYKQFRHSSQRGQIATAADVISDLVSTSIVFARVGYIPKNVVQNLMVAVPSQGAFLPVNMVRAGQVLNDPQLAPLFRAEVGMGSTQALLMESSKRGLARAEETRKVAGIVSGIADDPMRISTMLNEMAKEGIISSRSRIFLSPEDKKKMIRFFTDKRHRAQLNDVTWRTVGQMADFTRLTPDQARMARRLAIVPGWLMAGSRLPFYHALAHPTRTALIAYAMAGHPLSPEELRFNEPFWEYMDGRRFLQGIETPWGRWRTTSVSPIHTPWEILQAAYGSARGKKSPWDYDTETAFDMAAPGLATLVQFAQGGLGDMATGEAWGRVAKRLVPNYSLAEGLVAPEQRSPSYPEDATRWGRFKREVGVIPIEITDKPRGGKAYTPPPTRPGGGPPGTRPGTRRP
jgi:hypothetical protein